MVEYINMFLSHIDKLLDYFATVGLPNIHLADLPVLISYNIKLVIIYIMFFLGI